MHIWLQSHSQEKPKPLPRPTRGDCTSQTLPSPSPPPSSHEGPSATPGPLHLLLLCQEDSAPREATQLVSPPRPTPPLSHSVLLFFSVALVAIALTQIFHSSLLSFECLPHQNISSVQVETVSALFIVQSLSQEEHSQ